MAKITKHSSTILSMIVKEAANDSFGSELRVWDLMASAEKIMDFMGNDASPIYIAFRHQGCEVGSLEYIRERCKFLEKPYAIYKLSHENHVVISDITIENMNSLYE